MKKPLFEQMLSQKGTQIKASRASMISADARDAVEEMLRKYRKEKRDLEKKLDSLTDIFPDSELSLKVVTKDFNATKLFEEIHNTEKLIELVQIDVEIAERIYKKWFGMEEE